MIGGYLIFGVSAALLFAVTGQDPHVMPGAAFLVLSIAYGMVFAGIGGYAAAAFAPRRPVLHAAIVAGIIAVGATASLLAKPGAGAIWSEAAALVLMAPCAVIGGILRRRAAR